jgi:hypothetical protein
LLPLKKKCPAVKPPGISFQLSLYCSCSIIADKANPSLVAWAAERQGGGPGILRGAGGEKS